MPVVQRMTPGVYVSELSAFPPSVVGVQTAVPAFIGYTKTATLNGKPVTGKPVKIGCLADFEAIFGKDYPTTFDLTQVPQGQQDITIGGTPYTVKLVANSLKFYLYDSMRFFYANGGGNCYVVSAGDYSAAADFAPLNNALDAAGSEVGPTMVVIPDALLLDSANFNTLSNNMIRQCFALRDRVAILDVYGADRFVPSASPSTDQPIIDGLIDAFRQGVDADPEALSYGVAYFPCLATSVAQASDMDYSFFDLTATNLATLKTALTAEATSLYPAGARLDALKTKIGTISAAFDPQLDKDLSAALPVLKQIYAIFAERRNVLPPSGAMAGIYTYIDATRGVWNAPANTPLNAVVGPAWKISGDKQDDLNLPVEGKAINAIRDFVGRGTLVWGARTLDGNSDDYRYVQVRRTLIYVEQSVKLALNQFVFAPNDGQTWVTVTAMISNFLTGLWTQGGLMGAKASDAFSVQCGLGTTMTALDILNGYMRIQITLQMIHPAEFIELTFTQQMQSGG